MGKKNGKRLRAIVRFGMLAFLLAALPSCGSKKAENEEYRNIRISEYSGTVQVERSDMGTLDAYNGMMLQSEDVLVTGEESYLYLKLDEDKYAMLEPESRARLVASGNSQDSKTSIDLEQGAIVNRLDGDLSDNSVYEVNTPNSTMAVRGTNFRIEVRRSTDGTSYTDVSVYEGTVACRLIYPDGSMDEETVSGTGGNGIQIKGDGEDSVYIVIDGTVDYEKLPIETLEFLEAVMKEGVSLSISKEDMGILIETKKKEQQEAGAGSSVVVPSAIEETTAKSTAAPLEPSAGETPTKTPSLTKSLRKTAAPSPSLLPTATPELGATPEPTKTPAPISIQPEQSLGESDSSSGGASGDSGGSSDQSSGGVSSGGGSSSGSSGGLTDDGVPTESSPADPTPSASPTGTPSPSTSPTATPSPSASPTATPSPSASPTATPSPSASPTATPSPSASPTATPMPSAPPTATPSPSASPTATPMPSAPISAGDHADSL